MKYLLLLLLPLFIFSCRGEKLEPEEVAKRYIIALLKLEYKEAKKYASWEAVPAVDHRRNQIEKNPEKYLLDITKPVRPVLESTEDNCYKFTVFYTRINEKRARGVGETICVEEISGRWRVVLND